MCKGESLREAGMSALAGRTVLITGATDGVGRVVAERLGAEGARVMVQGRDPGRGREAVRAVEGAGGEAEFLPADLDDLDEVRRLADAGLERCPELHLLINNAGVGSGPPGAGRATSVQGYELRFAVNYLAGFLLTRLLLPRLLANAPGRIVNVASAGQRALDFGDLMLTRNYSGMRAYCQSKLAQILFTLDLAEELADSGVSVNALHPASYMATTMVRQAGVPPLSTVEEGAEAILRLATAPELEGESGRYFDRMREVRADAQAYDKGARRRLRAVSLELCGLGDQP